MGFLSKHWIIVGAVMGGILAFLLANVIVTGTLKLAIASWVQP